MYCRHRNRLREPVACEQGQHVRDALKFYTCACALAHSYVRRSSPSAEFLRVARAATDPFPAPAAEPPGPRWPYGRCPSVAAAAHDTAGTRVCRNIAVSDCLSHICSAQIGRAGQLRQADPVYHPDADLPLQWVSAQSYAASNATTVSRPSTLTQ